MQSIQESLAQLLDRIPRRHSTDNVKEIYSLADEYEQHLLTIEAENEFLETQVPGFFDDLDNLRAAIKKSTDGKASKKNKDNAFDEAAGIFKDSLQGLITLYANGDAKSN